MDAGLGEASVSTGFGRLRGVIVLFVCANELYSDLDGCKLMLLLLLLLLVIITIEDLKKKKGKGSV